jgi:succinate-acetate transporter protein
MSTRPGDGCIVVLRPIGSPTGLGLAGLVGGSLVASGVELGWLSPADRPHAALVFLAFSFPLQLVASILAFAARDGAVGTAMGLLSGTWLATALVWLTSAPAERSGALGLLLVAACGLLIAVAAAMATDKLAIALVLAVEGARFALAGIYDLGASETWQDAAGVVGLLVVVLAGYSLLAAVLEDATRRTVLPLGRRHRAVTADPAGEPGVRGRL